ncbi:Sal-like protein 1, partial [Stegodyphus mimosarum]
MEKHCLDCEEGSKYYCFCCGREFVSHSSLKTHIIVHSGERPVICRICYRTFCTKIYLLLHLQTHFR